MDVPVAEHFASADAAKYMRRIDMYTLSGEQQKRLRVLREEYGGIRTLTNPEMDFVLDVIEGVVKK
jgi:hypothetical protein